MPVTSRDPEVLAMATIASTLDELDDEARARVLLWATSRYQRTHSPVGQHKRTEQPFRAVQSTLHEFLDACGPESTGDRILAAAAFVAQRAGDPQFAASTINSELKNAGYGIANISKAIYPLMAQRPALITQVSKAGSTRQARKTYKITDAGIAYIDRLLSREKDNG